MSMSILIVEDELARRDAFKYKLREYVLDFADNALDAVKLLHTKQYDAVFLDHDLGDILTGQVVAKCFYESTNKKTPVLVHSINPDGSYRIVHILRDLKIPVEKCPFSSTVFWSCAKRFLEVGPRECVE